MSLSIGIVGLPNVGKSTLFKALTKKQVDASNYPFCTIDPNVGVVAVPDQRLQQLSEVSNSLKTIFTTIEFVDIAGLVKGASQGEGLGNKFLANIREVDAIVQVLRNFKNEDITHVSGKIDPESDKATINTELILADMETLQKRTAKNEKGIHGNDKDEIKLKPILDKLKNGFEQDKLAREFLSTKEIETIKELNLLTTKPMIYVLNVDENNINEESDYIAISAKIESELAELSEDEAKDYLKELKLNYSGLDKLINISYDTLSLITFFTSGEEESRAWTVKKGATAPQAAGVIHSDFEKKFIRAEVINWQDFVNCKGEQGAREKGLARLEGKEYIIEDGDVCHFRHG